MKFVWKDDGIIIDKELNQLDKFVLDFVEILNALKIDYVIISGYVAILFGRNRASEDIDLLLRKFDYSRFVELWKALNGFECIITSNTQEAYKDYLMQGSALRFAKKGQFIPNMEIKFPKDELDNYTLQNKKSVRLNARQLWISPIELQLSFKIFLGSEKDIEDARYLYKIFEKYADKTKIQEFCRKLNIEKKCKKYLQ